MGLAAIAAHKLGGIVPVGAIFKTSIRIGQMGQERSQPNAELPAVEPRPRGLPPEKKNMEGGMHKRMAAIHQAELRA
jgi:hypothetical protein